jgi:GntR family transcriptional regulator, transcriptional repressor for pyruvate dehydrogenase complex
MEPVSADAFPAILLPRAADAVTRALVDGLRAGVATEGSRMPRDHELAARFGVSRAVVRDALDRLRRAGVLEIRRGAGGGAIVRSLALPTDLLTQRDDLADEELLHLLEARRAIEMPAALLAGGRATDEDHEALDRLAARLTHVREDPESFIELDVHFHLRIAAASGNRQLEAFLAETFRELAVARSGFPTRYGSMQAAERFQHDTLAALRTRDPEQIRRSVDQHLSALEEHFLGHALSGGQ